MTMYHAHNKQNMSTSRFTQAMQSEVEAAKEKEKSLLARYKVRFAFFVTSQQSMEIEALVLNATAKASQRNKSLN